jgi:hypothetical protein
MFRENRGNDLTQSSARPTEGSIARPLLQDPSYHRQAVSYPLGNTIYQLYWIVVIPTKAKVQANAVMVDAAFPLALARTDNWGYDKPG